ncbi:uncharacterized protein LOC128547835 [Mercenaria mercenaria]|uniref:uncharacterized protein LOC128547835 n=1 Tax=Mercenaria mercenaria TaxID=6596 RepID=UPI00234F4698|nr:uncharacterized protein LOC128547835 [Mercenaria mercenaria]
MENDGRGERIDRGKSNKRTSRSLSRERESLRDWRDSARDSPRDRRDSGHNSPTRDPQYRNPQANSSAQSTRGKSPGDRNEAFEAFDLFRTYLDSQLSQLKNEITAPTQKVARDKKVKLNKESHKIQFEFNTDILEGLEYVSKQLSQPEFLKAEVKELIDKLRHRNKLIQIADGSPGGWATVSEYEKPVLGTDSDDEKKIRQAESRAAKKVKTATSKPNRYHPYNPNPFPFMYNKPSTTSNAGVDYSLPQRTNFQLF